MKDKILLPVLLIPLLLTAQADDYCSCMEADNNYDDLINVLANLSDEQVHWQAQQRTYHLNEVVIPVAPEPAPIVLIVKEEPVETPTEASPVEEVIPVEDEMDEDEVDAEAEVGEKADRKSKMKGKGKAMKAKMKRKAKRMKGKMKKRKKKRKYRGGCPNF